MRLNRRRLLSGVAATATANRLTRPAVGQSITRPLRLVPRGPLTDLGVLQTAAIVSRNHGLMVYDMLYGMGRDLEPSPQMAAGHLVQDGGRTWTITLRARLRFHDGEPVRATDCIASLRRWAQRDALGQAMFAYTNELVALDDLRLRFRFSRPFPLLPRVLAKPTPSAPFILPERLASIAPGQQVHEVVGSGPYRFVVSEWQPEARAVYSRFDSYESRAEPSNFLAGSKRAFIERVEWVSLRDPAAAAVALQAGEVDWLEQVTTDLVPTLRRRRTVIVDRLDPLGNLALLRVNHLHPPFDDPRARRALLPAVVQSDFMEGAVGPHRAYWRDRIGFFTPGSLAANDAGLEALTGPRDVSASQRALAAAGRSGAGTVLLAPLDIGPLAGLSQVAASLLRSVGLDVDYVATTWHLLSERRDSQSSIAEGGWSAFCSAASGLDFADPAVHFALRGNGTGAWIGWPSAPRLEELREAWMNATDRALAGTIAAHMQTQAFQDVPYYPLGAYTLPAAWRGDRFSGLPRSPVPSAWGVTHAV